MTSHSTLRQRTTAFLTALALFASSGIMPLAQAQGADDDTAVDYEPPLLEHDVLVRGVAGESQVFLAEASDDQGLEQVTLFYRFRGDEPYASLPMTPLEQSGSFTATVNTSPRDVRNIEYYIEARDVADNRVVQGFVFEPLVRVMEPAPQAIGEPDETTEAAPERMSLTRKIVYVALGILVVGGIAAAIDSSGDDNDSNAGGGTTGGGSTGGDEGGGDDSSGGDGGSDDAGSADSAGSDAGSDTDGGDAGGEDVGDAPAGDTGEGDGDTATETPVEEVPTEAETPPEVATTPAGGEPQGVQFGGSGLGFGVSF